MLNTGEDTLSQSKQLYKIDHLNGFSNNKTDFFILIHSGDKSYNWLSSSVLKNNFNFITIFYDIHTSYQNGDYAETLITQLTSLLKSSENCLIIGHSFNGYLAHQLASLAGTVSWCILIDAYNYFEPEDYNKTHGIKNVVPMILKHIFKTKDFALLTSFPFILTGNRRNRKNTDPDFFLGLEYLKDHYRYHPAINNCLYFQASRSRPGMNGHGESWRAYVHGDFKLVNINEDHIHIFNKSYIIIEHITKVCLL